MSAPRTAALADLGLGPFASTQEARTAWRVMARAHHPDQPGGNAARMARINAAWDHVQATEQTLPTPPPRPATGGAYQSRYATDNDHHGGFTIII